MCCASAVFSTLPSFAEQRPKVALVLSGGGARGGAHIGVLRVLEREGVPIDMIVGVSYGALVGGLYAAGYSVDDLQRVILETDWWEITSNSPDRRLSNMNRKPMADRQMLALHIEELKLKLPYGIFAGQKIHQFLNQLTIGATYRARNDFDQLPTPFRAIATDILSGEQVVIDNGSLGAAIRASISVPGVFAPLSTEHTHLVDGGIVNNLPVDVALDAGADFVIAVDCATPLRTLKEEIQDIIDVIDQAVSFRIEERKIANRKRSHVLILPELHNFDGSDFNRSYTLIPIGEQATKKEMDKIWTALQTLGVPRSAGEPRMSRLPEAFDINTWADIPPDVVIDKVRIEGVKRYSENLFKVRLEKFVNEPISFKELERECGRLHATGLFQTVDFHVFYHKGETELVFHVLENPPSELKVGIHYSNDYRVSVLGEIAHQTTLGRISEFHLRALAGNLNFAELVLIFRTSRRFGLLGEVQGWDQDRLYFRNRQREGGYKERRFRTRLGLQALFHSWGGFQAGYQLEHARIRHAARSIGDASEFLPGFSLSAGIDTRDDSIVPTTGVYLQTRAKWIHRTFSHKRIQAHLACFASPGSRWSVGIWSNGGYVTQPAPVFEFFPLGGAGHFSNAALPVVGLKRDELRVARFASVGVSVWRKVKFWESVPRSGIGIFYQGGLYDMSSSPEEDFTPIHGVGVGGYVNTTLLGPIRVEIVSTQKNDIKFNVSIGFGF
ncbi:MAG: patatin-like phospholipase family protein [Candidatus Latescibacteria bacterium]|nr:patatin-like phospholipase family protein [Candidatus Latescibacterota bacterium]